ncbi:hypothetical protein CFOLD11_11910 [Clostridium folliculivorans]|uniref:Uncharacterized protein n=1 Tax=Clostridium folliculivorans TaxID=2886038 RepID=A0A9W5Y0P4_9CLOT|nr:hypothetical protein [Clostridium folliculivorans]GKU24365.1 hypothetical protein CFOLD11_11910 [Clostridium folliculivorans]
MISLILGNTVKRYDPFSVKEVLYSKTNDIVKYAVFIDDDPLSLEFGFGTFPKAINSNDHYFFQQILLLIEQKLANQYSSLENAKITLQEILSNKVDDKVDENELFSIKKYITDRTNRIAFIEAARTKLKSDFKNT